VQRLALFEDKAIDCLLRTLEELPEARRPAFWRNQVQADPAFAPLRRVGPYSRLGARYAGTGL